MRFVFTIPLNLSILPLIDDFEIFSNANLHLTIFKGQGTDFKSIKLISKIKNLFQITY